MKKSFKITGIDCGHCAEKISDAVRKLEYVQGANYNFIIQKLVTLIEDGHEEGVVEKILKEIYKVERDAEVSVL